MAGEWLCGVWGDFGAGWTRSGAGITLLGVAGDVLEEFEDGDPTHTQNLESRSHRPRAWCVCLGVGGVPHQLYGGGRVRVPEFRADAKVKNPHAQCIRNARISAQK